MPSNPQPRTAEASTSPSSIDSHEEPSPTPSVSGSKGWRAIASAPLSGRENHVAVWTGQEMIVWGGRALLESKPGDPRSPEGYSYSEDGTLKTPLIEEEYRDGAAYDPAADSWRELPLVPVDEGTAQEAVWTGEEMLLWLTDRRNRLQGVAYDPATDSWRRLPPHPHGDSFAYATVWTGKEMIIAAGIDYSGKTPPKGAAYDPSTDTWRKLSPSPLAPPDWTNAIWAGPEMIVWGGSGACEGCPPWSGGFAYDPSTDTWRRLAKAPIEQRADFQAVWTGREVLVWGGLAGPYGRADGAVYDVSADTWRVMSASPLDARYWASAVWSGEEMIIWGGYNVYAPTGEPRVFGDGAAYNPRTDRWRNLPAAPLGRRCSHSAVWAESEMVVWGGTEHCGGDLSIGPPFRDGAAFTG